MIYNLYKQRGETPLERIRRFARENPHLKGQKMTYLGRLDPLAEGVLLVGTGEDTSQARREEFFNLDKEYDFVCLFGFATDTYDILGKIMRVEKVDELKEMDLIKISKIYEGQREQKYPLFSSKLINLARRDGDEEVLDENYGQPSKMIKIYELKFHGFNILNAKELFGRLLMDISRVNGDFRQTQILSLWKNVLFGKNDDSQKYFLGRFSANVSSGTYIRSLANDIGNTLNCGATTLSIVRNRAGDYRIEESLR